MGTPLRNLLISIGPGYHPAARLLHSVVKDASDSKILFFNPTRSTSSINEDLRIHYSSRLSELDDTLELLGGWLEECDFELIGMSFMSHYWEVFVELAQLIKKRLPMCKTIAGGVHAWHIDPNGTLAHCDYVCAAEGEELWASLVGALSETPAVPLRIPGLIERHDGEVVRTPRSQPYMPLDDLPFPSHGGKQIYVLNSTDDKPLFQRTDPLLESSFGYVHIGRGCPFRCTYCINSIKEDHRVRTRSVDAVIEEIESMLDVSQNIRYLLFMDEIFPTRTDWVDEFSEKYRARIGLPFQITLYPGLMNDKKLRALQSAGLKEVSMGIQSGSEATRRNVFHRADKNEAIIKENRAASGLRIMTYYDFIIYNPYESEDDFRSTLELVRSLRRPYYLKFYTLAFFPNHPITTRALAEGLIGPEEADASISYLDVTTPHRVALADHYDREGELGIWHDRTVARMQAGSIEAAYYLVTLYHGFWFIPKWALEFLCSQLSHRRMWTLNVFSFLVKIALTIRTNRVVRNARRVVILAREHGLGYAMRKSFSKVLELRS